jgi:hypothetical protein
MVIIMILVNSCLGWLTLALPDRFTTHDYIISSKSN